MSSMTAMSNPNPTRLRKWRPFDALELGLPLPSVGLALVTTLPTSTLANDSVCQGLDGKVRATNGQAEIAAEIVSRAGSEKAQRYVLLARSNDPVGDVTPRPVAAYRDDEVEPLGNCLVREKTLLAGA